MLEVIQVSMSPELSEIQRRIQNQLRTCAPDSEPGPPFSASLSDGSEQARRRHRISVRKFSIKLNVY